MWGPVEEPRTWATAEAFCQTTYPSGHLVSLRNRDAILQLYGALQAAGAFPAWIGLQRSSAGNFSEWSNGDPVQLVDHQGAFSGCASGRSCDTDGDCCVWKNQEPSNRPGEDCVQMGHSSKPRNAAGWNDGGCERSLPFVCEHPVNCGLEIAGLDTNAVLQCNPTELFVASSSTSDISCGITCATGFEDARRVSAAVRCGGEGSWIDDSSTDAPAASALTCQPKACPALSAPLGTTEGCARSLFQQTCTLTCADENFVASQNELVCGVDPESAGHVTWLGSTACAARRCGSTPSDVNPNVLASCNAEVDWATTDTPCVAECDSARGWLPDATTSGTYYCLAPGEWHSASPLRCVPIQCNAVPWVAHALVDCIVPASHNGSAHCVATCNPGYEGGVAGYVCGPDGQWHGELQCTPKDCSTMSAAQPPNQHAIGTCSSTTFGAECAFECDAGHADVAAGSGQHQCTEDGWTALSPVECVPQPCQPLAAAPFFDSLTMLTDCTSSPSIEACESGPHPNTGCFAEACTISCATGFTGAPAEYRCELAEEEPFSLHWQPSDPALPAVCVPVDCGVSLPALPLHAVSECVEGSHFFNDGCAVTCTTGHALSAHGGDGTYSCTASGTWTTEEAPQCVPVVCGDGSATPMNPHTVLDCSNGSQEFGEGCIAHCEAGYVRQSAVAPLTVPSNWTEDDCDAITCGKQCRSPCGWSTRLRQCRLNAFTAPDEETRGPGCDRLREEELATTTFFCGANGAWSSAEPLVCALIQCEPAIREIDEHAQVTCTGSALHDTCEATCARGYIRRTSRSSSEDHSNVAIFGGPQQRGEFTCGINGTWIGSTISCDPVDCGEHPVPHGAVAIGACAGMRFGDTCNLQCDHLNGYQAISGDGQYTCGSSGDWTGTLHCEIADCSALISDLELAAAYEYECSSTTFGSTCNVGCAEGYVGQPVSYTCSPDLLGEWGLVGSDSPSCVARSCPPLPDSSVLPSEPGSMAAGTCVPTGTVYGSTCHLGCNERQGYEVVQGGSFSCSSSGEWVGLNASVAGLACALRSCPITVPQLDAHANLSGCNDGPRVGAICRGTCDAGYWGAQTVANFMCNVDGTWDGDLVCVPNDCGPIPSGTIAAHATLADCGSSLYGAEPCFANCDQGYASSTRGSQSFTCGATSTWHVTPFECIPVACPSSVPVPDTKGAICEEPWFGGAPCSLVCSEGFEAVSGSAEFRCQASGVWVGNLTCGPRQCRSLDNPSLDDSSCAGAVYGDSCEALCRPGYHPASTGSMLLQCDGAAGGVQLIADTDDELCLPLLCPKYVQAETRVVNCSHQDRNFGGGGCLAECESDFYGGLMHYVCSADGTWARSSADACAPIQCPVNELARLLPSSASVSDCAGGAELASSGTMCTAGCSTGSTIGDGTYICSTSGQWEGGCGFMCMEPESVRGTEIYTFQSTPLTYDAARDFCRDGTGFGLQLASIVTRAENEFVFGKMRTALGNDAPAYWIGSRVDHTGNHPVLNWENGAVETYRFGRGRDEEYRRCDWQVNSTNPCLFEKSEPNNFGGRENCIGVGLDSGRTPRLPTGWNDIDCSNTRGFVCRGTVPSNSSTCVARYTASPTLFATELASALFQMVVPARWADVGESTYFCELRCGANPACLGFVLDIPDSICVGLAELIPTNDAVIAGRSSAWQRRIETTTTQSPTPEPTPAPTSTPSSSTAAPTAPTVPTTSAEQLSTSTVTAHISTPSVAARSGSWPLSANIIYGHIRGTVTVSTSESGLTLQFSLRNLVSGAMSVAIHVGTVGCAIPGPHHYNSDTLTGDPWPASVTHDIAVGGSLRVASGHHTMSSNTHKVVVLRGAQSDIVGCGVLESCPACEVAVPSSSPAAPRPDGLDLSTVAGFSLRHEGVTPNQASVENPSQPSTFRATEDPSALIDSAPSFTPDLGGAIGSCAASCTANDACVGFVFDRSSPFVSFCKRLNRLGELDAGAATNASSYSFVKL